MFLPVLPVPAWVPGPELVPELELELVPELVLELVLAPVLELELVPRRQQASSRRLTMPVG